MAVQGANTGHLQLTNWTPSETSRWAVKMNPLLLCLFVCFNPLLLSKLAESQADLAFGECCYSQVPLDDEPRAGTCPVVVGMGVLGHKSWPLGGLP